MRKQGKHGDAFGYKTINTIALGWIISRVTKESVSQLLSERIWRKLGAEQDAYYTVDSIGTPYAGRGLNAGLRDLARIGQLLLDDGVINNERLVPAAAIKRIRAGGDKTAFEKAGYANLKGWSYRGMWWVCHNEHGAFMARGVHGQASMWIRRPAWSSPDLVRTLLRAARPMTQQHSRRFTPWQST